MPIYPLTIISDRYLGTYSGGKYLAFNLDYDSIPIEINSGDVECGNFWIEHRNLLYGKGETPALAYIDLINKLKKEKENA